MSQGQGALRRLVCAVVATMALSFAGTAGEPPGPVKTPAPDLDQRDIFDLSLSELASLKVTSVAKRPELLSETAAAIRVLTQDDIRRSGATTIAEALRLVPGLNVARQDSFQWGISSRGFNGVLANKLLVLIDGRSVYTPQFAGVRWDTQDTLLSDIDRIEVINGPGATLWGSNAVNGVINIITKSAKATEGGHVQVGAGTEERGFGEVRYGFKINEEARARVYAKVFERDAGRKSNGEDAVDDWRNGQGGFRLDWEPTPDNAITFQGDAYYGIRGQQFLTILPGAPFQQFRTQDTDVAGANLLSRWTHTHSSTASSQLQAYYDFARRRNVLNNEDRHTIDLDFQHQFQPHPRHAVTLGAGFRMNSDTTQGSFTGSFTPDDRTTRLPSAFIQDEITVIPERLRLTVGSKFEYNDYTGFEFQPNVRLAWTPQREHTVWAAATRAVRIPSRAEEDLTNAFTALPPGSFGPGSPTTVFTLFGDKNSVAEELHAFELGYRSQPHKNVALDFAGFANFYDNLRTTEPGALRNNPANGTSVFPFVFANRMHGESYGGEASVQWQAQTWWRLTASYTHVEMFLHRDRASRDTTAENPEGNSPRSQFQVRSAMELPENIELDLALRFVDRLENQGVPSYTELDARIGWRPLKRLDVSLIGRSLLHARHQEFNQIETGSTPSRVPRSVFLRITFDF